MYIGVCYNALTMNGKEHSAELERWKSVKEAADSRNKRVL